MTIWVFDLIAEYIRACHAEGQAAMRRAKAEEAMRTDKDVRQYFHGESGSSLSARIVVTVDNTPYCCEHSNNALDSGTACLEYLPVAEIVPDSARASGDDSEPE